MSIRYRGTSTNTFLPTGSETACMRSREKTIITEALHASSLTCRPTNAIRVGKSVTSLTLLFSIACRRRPCRRTKKDGMSLLNVDQLRTRYQNTGLVWRLRQRTSLLFGAIVPLTQVEESTLRGAAIAMRGTQGNRCGPRLQVSANRINVILGNMLEYLATQLPRGCRNQHRRLEDQREARRQRSRESEDGVYSRLLSR